MRIRLEEATWALIHPISEDLREADRSEVWAARHQSPAQALMEAFARSEFCWVLLADGRSVIAGGAAPMEDQPWVGIPWLLSTPGIELPEVRFWLARHSIEMVRKLLARFYALENYTHAANLLSIQWLKKIGFRVDPPAPYGEEQEMFCRIYADRELIHV